jgi:calcineurin-like phosphoesterase family protein
MAVWFWSDPHFFHKNVIRLCDRPFDSLDHMHETLIERYNSVVKPEDSCVWVGDCFFTKNTERVRPIMNRLNGMKALIRGNHDHSPQKMLNLGFSTVQDEMWMTVAGRTVQVCHYPFRHDRVFSREPVGWLVSLFNKKPHADLRYLERRPLAHGQYLIHGHTHSSQKSIHVGVDANNFTPVSLEEIRAYIERYERC